MILPNFTADELRCRGTGLLQLAPGFGQALQGLRDALTNHFVRRYGPSGEQVARMVVSSCCRAKEHNDRPAAAGGAGGHPRSLHIGDQPHWPTGGACAVDIVARAGEVREGAASDEYREVLTSIAWARGWSIGHAPWGLHLDLRTEYACLTQVEFEY